MSCKGAFLKMHVYLWWWQVPQFCNGSRLSCNPSAAKVSEEQWLRSLLVTVASQRRCLHTKKRKGCWCTAWCDVSKECFSEETFRLRSFSQPKKKGSGLLFKNLGTAMLRLIAFLSPTTFSGGCARCFYLYQVLCCYWKQVLPITATEWPHCGYCHNEVIHLQRISDCAISKWNCTGF